MLAEPMLPLPTDPSDPRLNHWYHTIELRPGVVTRGVFNHRPVADKFGLPKSLAGKTALDVGTADGFWAFELERRGAAKVTAVDVACLGESDLLPVVRARWPEARLTNTQWPQRFATAHHSLGSKVDYRHCSIYDLSPDRVGTFDVVFCGSLLLHLMNPLKALIGIRSVTRELAVIETAVVDPDLEQQSPGRPIMLFGVLDHETAPGENVTYWRFSTKALCDMLIYAGFRTVEPQGVFNLSADLPVTSVVARV
jgi:tRNA (mo5U34)-methyltransferase